MRQRQTDREILNCNYLHGSFIIVEVCELLKMEWDGEKERKGVDILSLSLFLSLLNVWRGMEGKLGRNIVCVCAIHFAFIIALLERR